MGYPKEVYIVVGCGARVKWRTVLAAGQAAGELSEGALAGGGCLSEGGAGSQKANNRGCVDPADTLSARKPFAGS